MNTSSTILFLLLQRAVGKNASLPQKIDAETWQKVYELAKQQALLGIVFLSIDSLEAEQRPPKALIMQWWGMTERIKQQSKRLNEVAEKVEQRFAAFNRVYILSHIYRHLFDEGVGLRQLMDYYYVLRQGFTEAERQETLRMLKQFKMVRFAEAVMWVLQEVFGLEAKYMLTTPNEREGKFLLDEIMMAGNFGHYDPRIIRSQDERLFIRFVELASRWGWHDLSSWRCNCCWKW